MNTAADLIVIGALAAIWLIAGFLADGLPVARTTRGLRRRAGVLCMLIVAGTAVFAAIPLVTGFLPGVSSAPAAALLAAVPALLVLTATSRRLTQVRQGAAAFATAPSTPVPPALRAAAAHPLIAAPLQVTGLAALVGLPIAARVVDVPRTDIAGIAITVVGVAVATIGIRHAVRHSRFSGRAIAPLRPAPKGIATRVS